VKLAYHYFPRSHWSRIISLVLFEKGLWNDVERNLVDIRENASFDPDYLRLNPRGVVPTLVVDGEAWCNSPNIATRLDAVTGPPMMPSDPNAVEWVKELERAKVMHLSYEVWTRGLKGEQSKDILDDKVERARLYADAHPAQRELYERKGLYFQKFRDELRDPEHMRGVHDQTRATLSRLSARVQADSWAAGSSWSFADAIATSMLFRLVDLGSIDEWNVPADPLYAYYERLKARPSFAAVWTDDPMLAVIDGE